ncbi:hypothetical protein [Thermomonas hydrothermalis]|uniref:hypothetical protein n=1 Tax=Thermomonas hydrothermalis TaxID=213588 RepID=UPI003D0C2466
MRFVAGPLNKQLLQNLLGEVIESCTRVRAAVAYASRDNMLLFEACARHLKPLEFFGRYDHTVAVDPAVLKWFLDKASSANWDARSLRLNFEFNVEVYDTALSTRLESLFDAARDASGEISAMALRARPLAIRLRDGVARLFTPIL